MKIHPAEKYAKDILSEKIPACKWVKLSCERYFTDKDSMISNGWKFDRKEPIRVIKFFEKILKHYQDEWAGKPFILEPWQQFILWNLYGFKNTDDTRRFTEAGIFVPRKNGKTELAVGCGLYGMGFDGTKAAEVYSIANDREQAKVAWLKGKYMVEQSTVLRDYLEPMAQAIYSETYVSTFKPWSADSGRKDGYSPSFVIDDEHHANKTNRMVEVVESGFGGRQNPMLFRITTAGFNISGPCFKYQEMCQRILEGKTKQDNLFSIIWTPDKKDDWNDPKVWEKVNPSWDAIPTIEKTIRKNYTKAINSKDSVNFKTKHLNIWTRASKTWIEDNDFQECYTPYTPENLHGQTCFGGLDLSDSYDLSAFSLYFPEEKKYLRWFFLPEEKLNERGWADDVNYQEWVDDGWITVTPGNVIDYDFIRYAITGRYINENGLVSWSGESIADKFDLVQIAFDRWGATQIMIQLTDDGIELLKHGQGYADMSNPTKNYKKMIIGKEINHNGNPVSRWMIGNTVIKRDPANNEKPVKDESKGKIDGTVTDIMALNAAQRYEENNTLPSAVVLL